MFKVVYHIMSSGSDKRMCRWTEDRHYL